MELNNDEVVNLSCLLRNCRSKHRYELDGAEDIIIKVCNEAVSIVATRAQKHLKPSSWM
jgi:hypothetical protein